MSPSATTVSDRCDELVLEHSLLKHSFYQRWSAGTLPVPALKDYAREYGAFIRQIGSGWEAAGQSRIARVEDHHSRIWESTFAAGLGTDVADPQVEEVADLLTLSRELFADRATALGALYAFEAQQPQNADAKLRGLREHYPHLPSECGRYFQMHVDDYDEPALLANEMNGLGAEDQARARDACERMCRALYDALTGIERPYPGEPCHSA